MKKKPRNKVNNLIKQYRKRSHKLQGDIWKLAYYLDIIRNEYAYRNDVNVSNERFRTFMKQLNRERIRRYIKMVRDLGIYENYKYDE